MTAAGTGAQLLPCPLELLWLVARRPIKLEGIGTLCGLRMAIGAEAPGMHAMIKELLAAN